MAISTINFFGNHFSIYQGSEIPVIVGTPITIADFTSTGVYSIGAGGGCLGVHTGLIQFATQELPKITGNPIERVSVPWSDTPPGVVCYYDLEAKPLDVLNGSVPGDSELAGSMPNLTHIGVPIAPATPDVTPQATEVLDFDPDVIVFSAQGADCWNLVDGLGRLGWTPEQIPLVLSGACIDFTAMKAAGDLAKGIYITGTENGLLEPLDGLEGEHLEMATTYQTKGLEYGLSEDDLFKGFAAQGFSVIMNIWEVAQNIDGDVTGQAISDAFSATDGSQPAFGGSPLNCAGAPTPYTAVCSSPVSITQWDGEKLAPVLPSLSGLDLVAGTELKPGPD
jgi:branched-chain amino acid transport system substrate-binding protein